MNMPNLQRNSQQNDSRDIKNQLEYKSVKKQQVEKSKKQEFNSENYFNLSPQQNKEKRKFSYPNNIFQQNNRNFNQAKSQQSQSQFQSQFNQNGIVKEFKSDLVDQKKESQYLQFQPNFKKINYFKDEKQEISNTLMMTGFEVMSQSEIMLQKLSDIETYQTSKDLECKYKLSNNAFKTIFTDGKILVQNDTEYKIIFQKWTKLLNKCITNFESVARNSLAHLQEYIEYKVYEYVFNQLIDFHSQLVEFEFYKNFKSLMTQINILQIVKVDWDLVVEDEFFQVIPVIFKNLQIDFQLFSDQKDIQSLLIINFFLQTIIKFAILMTISEDKDVIVYQVVHQIKGVSSKNNLLEMATKFQFRNNFFQYQQKQDQIIENYEQVQISDFKNNDRQPENLIDSNIKDQILQKISKDSSKKVSNEEQKNSSNQSSFGIKQKNIQNIKSASHTDSIEQKDNSFDRFSDKNKILNSQIISTNSFFQDLENNKINKSGIISNQFFEDKKKQLIEHQFADIVIIQNKNISNSNYSYQNSEAQIFENGIQKQMLNDYDRENLEIQGPNNIVFANQNNHQLNMYQIDQNADRQREQSQQNQEVIVDQVKTPNQKSQFYHLNENEEEKNHSSHETSQRNSLQRDSLNIDKLQGHSPQISLQGHQVSSGAQQNTSQQLPSSKLKTNSFFSSQLQGSNGTPIFSIDSSKNVQSNYLAFKGQSIMNQNEKNNSNCSISYPIKKQSQYSMQTENVSSHQIHNNNNLTLSSNYYMMNKKSIQSERRQSNSKNNQFQNLSGHQQSNNQQIQPLKAKNTNNINSQMQRYYQRSNSEYYAKTQNVLSKKKNNEFNSFQLSSKAQSQIVRGHKVKKVKNLIKQELFDRLTSNFAMCSNSKYNIDLQKIEEMKENLEGQQRFMNMVVHDMRNPAEAVNTGLKQAREISKIQTAQIIKDTQQIIKKNHSQIARKIKGGEQKNNIPITLNKYKVGSDELQKQEHLQRNNSQQINNNQKSKYNQIIKNNKKNSFPVQSLSQQNNNENSEISYSKQQISDIQMSLKSINSQKSQNFNSDNKQKYQESINKSKELQQQSIFSQQNNRMGQQNNQQNNINNESSIANIQQRQQIQQSSFNRQLIFNRQFEEEEKVPENNNQNNYYQPFFQGQSDQYEFVPYSAVFGQNQHIVPQINPNQHTDQKNIKNSSNKNNQQDQIKAEAFNQSIEPIENTEQNDLMKILQLIQNEQQKEEIIPYNSIGLQLQIEEDDQIVQRDQINEDSEYDFESDDIDEESGLNANQIKLENNIPQSSLIINQPRQININDGANFKREAAVNKNVNYIEKIIPVFQQENVLKIERQVQTDNQQSNRESELVHQLIQNKDFLDFSQNYYEYIQILKVQRELNGQNLKSNDAMQILKQQVLQSNNNQIVDQIQQNNSPIFMIGQSQNQQLLLQNDDLRISKFNDDNQLLIPQNNMNMSHNQIQSDSDRIIPRKSQMKQNTDQQSYISHQHNKSLYSDNDQKAKDCFTCESYMKSLSLILEQFQKLLKVNQTLDYYSQNSISSSQIILNLIEDLLSLAKINKNVFEINNDPEINLIEIVQEAFQVTSFNAETKQIKLLLQIDISQPFILKRVITDRRRILQILLNFLSNSIKFTAQGGYIMVKFKVLEEQVQHESIKSFPLKSLVTNSEENIIKAEKIIEKQLYQQKNQMPMFDKTETLSQKSLDVNSQFLINSYKDITKFIKLKITIEDNGAGIQQENIDKLFTDFQKLNEHKKMNLKGTGLGLSICKQIIELMGGKVTINSEVGVGTKFNIILQLKVIDRIFLNNGNFLMTQNQKIQHLQSLGAFRFTENFNKLFRQNENTAQTIDIYSDDNDNQNQITQIKEDELRMDKQIEKYNFVQLNQQQNQDDNEVSIKNIINQVKDLYNKEKQLMSEFQSNQECKSQSVSIYYNSLISLKDGQYGLSIRDNSQHISIENQKECNENRDNLCNPKNILIRKSSNGLQEEKKYQEQNEHIKKNSDQKEMFSFSHIQLSQMSKQAIYFANKNSNSQKNSNTLSSNGKYKLSSQNSQIEELNPQILHVNQQFLKQEEIKKVNIMDEILEKNESSSIKIILSSPRNQLKLNYYKEAKQILQKYKKRKLNILVANDDSYSLFVIQTTMQQLKSVGQVDIASNGQIALDLVKQNEKINSENKNCHYYDAIFLDLEMPILNGHEACKLIQNYYQMINSASGFDILIPQNLKKSMNNIGLIQEDIEKIENRNSNFQDLWIVDLKYLYDMYQDLITMKQDNIEKQQSNESQINEEQIEPKILKIFNAHYSSQRYQVLKYMNRPFMFAYSAMINGKIQEKVKQSGFEECIDAPLNKIKIETMISEYLNLYAFNLTNQLLTKQGPVPNFVDMIDDMRIKKIWMESSSEMERSIGSLQSRDLKSININELSNNNSQDQKILDQQNDGSFKMFEMNYEKENGFQIQKQNGKEYHSVNVQQYDELSNIMEVQEKEEINSQYSIFLSNGEVKHNQEIQNVEFEIEDEIEEQFSLQENINYPMGSSSLNRFVDKSLNP